MEIELDWEGIHLLLKDLQKRFSKKWSWESNHPGLVVHEFNLLQASDIHYRWNQLHEQLQALIVDYLRVNYNNFNPPYLQQLGELLKDQIPGLKRVYLTYSEDARIHLKYIAKENISKYLQEIYQGQRLLGEDLASVEKMMPKELVLEIKWELVAGMDMEDAGRRVLTILADTVGQMHEMEALNFIQASTFYTLVAEQDFVLALESIAFISDDLALKSLSCAENEYFSFACYGHRFINTQGHWTKVDDFNDHLKQSTKTLEGAKLKKSYRLGADLELTSFKEMIPPAVQDYFVGYLGPDYWSYVLRWWDQLSVLFNLKIKDWMALLKDEQIMEHELVDWFIRILGWEDYRDFLWEDLKPNEILNFKIYFLKCLKNGPLDFEIAALLDTKNAFYRLETFYLGNQDLVGSQLYFFADGIKLKPKPEQNCFASALYFENYCFELIQAMTEEALEKTRLALLDEKQDLRFEVMLDEDQRFYVELYLNEHAIWNLTQRFKSALDCYEVMDVLSSAWQQEKKHFIWKPYYQKGQIKVDVEDQWAKVFVCFNKDALSAPQIEKRWKTMQKYLPMHLTPVKIEWSQDLYVDRLRQWQSDSLDFEATVKWMI